MKTLGITLFFSFFIFSVSAQTLLTFDQQEGNGEYFEINQGKLALNAPQETGKRMWTYSILQEDKMEWELEIQLDFSPSSSNYVECYLMADSFAVDEGNAYVLRWGMSGSEDVLQFYYQEQGSKTKLAEGNMNLSQGGNIHVKLARTITGEWHIYLNDVLEIKTKHMELMTGNYLGLICTHTATRYNLFSFDNISIQMEEVPDLVIIDNDIHDIVFTEVLLDTDPVIFLPKSQYIEIYNQTDSIISLENWSLLVEGENVLLPAYQLLPKSYIVLCPKEHVNLFTDPSYVVGIDSWKKLSEKSGMIQLLSSQNKEIDQLIYDQRMINQHSTKARGGWALEKQDINYFCDTHLNWKYSESTMGGSPTKINSINAEYLSVNAPIVEKHYIIQQQLHVQFDKSIDDFELKSVHELLDTIIKDDYELIFQFDTINQEQEMILTVEGCQENKVNIDIVFGPVKQVEKNEIFINEILANPYEEGSEFIELYNASNHFIELSSLVLGTWDNEGVWKDKINLPNYLFLPHSYVVLTTHKKGVTDYYSVFDSQQVVEVDLPTLINEEGIITLATATGEILETIVYNEALHSSFLGEEKGVSLERESIECIDCWSSASQTTGWASPTNENSQQTMKQEQVSLQSSILTPNNDEQEDQLVIDYAFEEESWTASFYVFAKNGYKITTFGEQTYLGKQGTMYWNLKDQSQHILPVGFYVLIIELYNEKGETKQFKFPFVIAL